MHKSDSFTKWFVRAAAVAALALILIPNRVRDSGAANGVLPPALGDGICEFNETCEDEPACGACDTDPDFASCPTTLTDECDSDTQSCCYKKFAAGTIIIPMDRCHQLDGSAKLNAPTAGDAFCEDEEGGGDDGMFHAYGLVYRLMQNDIPVYWTVNPTKDPPQLTASQALNSQSYNDRDIDFWVLNPDVSAPPQTGGSTTNCTGACEVPVVHLDSTAGGTLGHDADYSEKEFPVRGGAFVIDAADVPEFKAFWAYSSSSPNGKDYSGFSGNSLYDFSAVELYELQPNAQIVYLDYSTHSSSAVTPYNIVNGGAAPVATVIDYAPPRLAREAPAGVSTLWLAKANLNDPAAYPACLLGDFQPSTAVFCDMSNDEMEAGYLVAGQFNWAWLDSWNAQSNNCSSYAAQALMTNLDDFMVGTPGIRDGNNVMLMGSAMTIAEQCTGLQPLGNDGGLQDTNQTPNDPLIIRYPSNLFSQMGDLPPAFAAGSSGAKWEYDPYGYQNLKSLRRLITEDTGTLCTDHISTPTCDEFDSSSGDQDDAATYARYKDDSRNGLIFYMGGRQVTQNSNAAHLRMVLNALIATPTGQPDPPVSSITTEVARSTPVVGTVASTGVETYFQGTIDVLSEAITTYSGTADDSSFRFPHFKGHFRAVDTAYFTDETAKAFTGITGADPELLWDAADGIPTPTLAGCTTHYTASCRTVFTTTTQGDNTSVANRPTMTFFNTTNAATLQPLLSDSSVTLTTTEAQTLIGRVLAGRDDTTPGTFEPELGGVDRSSVAVVEDNTDFGYATRPAVAYFGALDGMVHAVCAEVKGACTSLGQELWAFIPRSNLPHLRYNRQRVDGSMTVDDIFADFDHDGNSEYRTVLTFNISSPTQAAGISGQEPAVYGIDITVPTAPVVLWELNPPTTRGSVEMGIGLDVAMGTVDVSGTSTPLTFVQTNNGGTGGPGFAVLAINSATGAEVWTYEHVYPNARGSGNPLPPANGYPLGVAVYDEDSAGTITHVVVPSLYGDIWKLNADDGTSVLKDVASPFDDIPLFRSSVDFRPIGATPAIFKEKGGSNRWIAVFGTGGYTAPGSSLIWSPSSTLQYGGLVDLGGTTTVDETGLVAGGALTSGLRVFAQPTIAGNELFIVADDSNVNDYGYGQSGSNTGTLMRAQLDTGATVSIDQTTSISGGSGSAAVNNTTGTTFTGSGASAKKTVASSFEAGGTDITSGLGGKDGTRLMWLRLR